MLPWIRKFRMKRTVVIGTVCLATVFFIGSLLIARTAFAQSALDVSDDTFGLQSFESATDLGGYDIRIVVARIVRAFLGLLGIITIGLILYAGYLIMTSGGSEDKVAEGKKIIVNAVIGLIIILSAFAITQFILNALTDALGLSPDGRRGRGAQTEGFRGSGALGRIVRDHYPLRDQTAVPRNTKIVVTFREAIDPASLIIDANDNGTLGDCVNTTLDTFDWELYCDRLVTSSVRLYRTNAPTALTEAAVLAEPEGDEGRFYTFVFQPLDAPLHFLGSATSTVTYTVDLTERIRKADGRTSAFVSERAGHYVWEFETDTNIDTTPPSVTHIYPRNDERVPRNSIVQITFSEPMDPIVTQGLTGTFTHILLGRHGNNLAPPGEWRLSNGYRTAEFVSDDACGLNSCGEIMFCLPITCTEADPATCENDYSVLIRTAQVFADAGSESFEAIPYSGVMDLAGNALDSNEENRRLSPSGILPPDGNHPTPNNRPTVVNINFPDAAEEAEDNFWWYFAVRNSIDRAAPYVRRVSPPVDEENVPEDAPLYLEFSRLMWSSTLGSVALEEYPAGVNGVDPIWYRPHVEVLGDIDPSTRLYLDHRAFGPNDADLYYFPSIPSSVRSVNQNCLYPGRGPLGNGEGTVPAICDYENRTEGCVPVTVDSETDTGCVQMSLQEENGENLLLQPTVAECLETLRRDTVSPVSEP